MVQPGPAWLLPGRRRVVPGGPGGPAGVGGVVPGLLTHAVFVGMHRPGDVGLGGPAVQGVVIGGTNVPQHGIEVIVAAGIHGVPPSRPPGH